MILLDTVFDRTLDAWVREFSAPEWRGAHVEGWLFEGPEARRSAQATLARAGVTAHLRSAYKPLLHHVLEEVDPAGLRRIAVRYPVHPQAAPNRYTLEAYPLADLLPGVAVSFMAGEAELLDPMPRYAITLHYADGREREQDVAAPNLLQDTPEGPACCGYAMPMANGCATPPGAPSTRPSTTPRCPACAARHGIAANPFSNGCRCASTSPPSNSPWTVTKTC